MIGIPQLDDRIEPIPECGCWIWTGSVNSRGYGVVKIKGRQMYVHHVVWRKYHKKPIPKGMVMLHKCDTRRCCNPLHTHPGSHRANMRDMCKKGRQATKANGRHHAAKLAFRMQHGYFMEAK